MCTNLMTTAVLLLGAVLRRYQQRSLRSKHVKLQCSLLPRTLPLPRALKMHLTLETAPLKVSRPLPPRRNKHAAVVLPRQQTSTTQTPSAFSTYPSFVLTQVLSYLESSPGAFICAINFRRTLISRTWTVRSCARCSAPRNGR